MPKRQAPRNNLRAEDLAGMVYAMYVRCSTRDQSEGYGPEMQRQANLRFAEQHGLVDSGLVFEEYVSGGYLKGRAEISAALEALRAGRFQVLLVGWTHRFARSMEDAKALRRQIGEANGILAYTGQGIISGQSSNRLGENVLHALDEEYRENLSDLIGAALRTKWENAGANGLPPLGSRHVYIRRDGTTAEGPERQTTAVRVADPETLPILTDLLRRYSESGSYRKTAEHLNDRGHRSIHGRLFTPASIRTIVGNPYYGPQEIIRYHPFYADEQGRETPAERQIFPVEIHDRAGT